MRLFGMRCDDFETWPANLWFDGYIDTRELI